MSLIPPTSPLYTVASTSSGGYYDSSSMFGTQLPDDELLREELSWNAYSSLAQVGQLHIPGKWNKAYLVVPGEEVIVVGGDDKRYATGKRIETGKDILQVYRDIKENEARFITTLTLTEKEPEPEYKITGSVTGRILSGGGGGGGGGFAPPYTLPMGSAILGTTGVISSGGAGGSRKISALYKKVFGK